MYDYLDYLVGALVVFAIAFLLIGVPVLVYKEATETQEVWNRCNPHAPISKTEAVFGNITITHCDDTEVKR